MKIILATVIFFAAQAFAGGSPFYTDINGVRYYCSPENNQPGDGGDVLDCIDKAYAGPFSKAESEQLCQGANSTGPADCAIKAYSGPFSKTESLQLCQGAYSIGPGECANTAYAGPFSKTESLQLCSSRSATVETANCAIRAYAGPYSKEESIRICKSNLVAESSTLAFLKTTDQSQAILKAQQQIKISIEKLADVKAKAFQRVQDLKLKN